MASTAFPGLEGKLRHPRPRNVGRTMVVDWGYGVRAQRDLVETGGAFVDLAKIAVGISGLLPERLLRRKLTLYRRSGIEPFPGGQFLEFAQLHGLDGGYFAEARRVGYRWVEVSSNLASVSLEWKQEMIREASSRHGFEVIGEVGRKEGLAHPVPLVEDAQACLDAGASLILVEAAELVSGEPHVAKEVEQVIEALPEDVLMFELPGPWIEGVALSDIHQLFVQLAERFGAALNAGNVAFEDVIRFEAFRRGVGVNAGKAV